MDTKILGRKIAQVELHWDKEDKKYIPIHNGVEMLVGAGMLELNGITPDMIDSCVAQIQKMNLDDLKKEFGYSDEGYKNGGASVVCDADPRLVASIQFGSMRQNDVQYEILNGFPTVNQYPIDLTVCFFLDVDGIFKELEIPEREVTKEEAALLDLLRKETSDNKEAQSLLFKVAGPQESKFSDIEKMLFENDEKDGGKSIDAKEVITALIKSVGFDAKEAPSPEICLELSMGGKPVDMLCVRESKLDGLSGEIVVYLFSDPENECKVEVKDGEVVSNGGLPEVLNAIMPSGKEEEFMDMFEMKVDKFGIPLVEVTQPKAKKEPVPAPIVESSHEMKPPADAIKPMSTAEKDKEIEKKDGVSAGAKDGMPEGNVVGQDVIGEKPSQEKKGEVESGEKAPPAGADKTGDAKDGTGKHMEEENWRKLSNRQAKLLESIRKLELRVNKLNERADAKKMGAGLKEARNKMRERMEAKKMGMKKPMGGMKKPMKEMRKGVSMNMETKKYGRRV